MSFEKFCGQINVTLLLDPSGRGGNYFVQSLFDLHPQVVSCPWIQYQYTYFLTKFGNAVEVDSKEAHLWWTQRSYFRLIYQPEEEVCSTIESFGAAPSARLNRETVRACFDEIVLKRPTVLRRTVLLAGYYAYLRGMGLPVDQARYILLSDAVTLRTENPKTGYSVASLRIAREDFPALKVLWLERDVRAAFASCRHQYVNEWGGMYGPVQESWKDRLTTLFRFTPDPNGCSWVYWIWYCKAAEEATQKVLNVMPTSQVYLVRNEDLNLAFIQSIKKLVKWLGVDTNPVWFESEYHPTNLGEEWKGKGAYCAHYRKGWEILKNDSPEVSRASAGPNKHVTERWKKSLSLREQNILADLFQCELQKYGYEQGEEKSRLTRAIRILLLGMLPWRGEIPDIKVLSSLAEKVSGWPSLLQYSLFAPLFYIGSRLMLLMIVVKYVLSVPAPMSMEHLSTSRSEV